MKKMMAIVLALAGAGCVEVERQEFDALDKSLKNLEIQSKNQNELHVHLYNELVQKHAGLVKQVTEVDVLFRAMQSSVAQLETQVKALVAAGKLGPKPPDGPQIAPPPVEKIEDILLHVNTTIGELRKGTLKTEEAVTLLTPYALHAVPKVLDELAGAVTKFDYAKQLESILSKFPPDSLKTPIKSALGQRGLRESAARVVGQTKNPDLGKLLEDHSDANDEDFKRVIGEALVLCRNAKGIPILVVSLRSGEVTTRTIAISTLKRLARGQDFGYRAQSTNEQNAAALKSWEEWFEKGGKTIFD